MKMQWLTKLRLLVMYAEEMRADRDDPKVQEHSLRVMSLEDEKERLLSLIPERTSTIARFFIEGYINDLYE